MHKGNKNLEIAERQNSVETVNKHLDTVNRKQSSWPCRDASRCSQRIVTVDAPQNVLIGRLPFVLPSPASPRNQGDLRRSLPNRRSSNNASTTSQICLRQSATSYRGAWNFKMVRLVE